jgi:hypothetical protein
VKDYHERQYANTQTAGRSDNSQLLTAADQLTEITAVDQQAVTSGAPQQTEDRLEIARDGLGLILERLEAVYCGAASY